MVPNATSVMAQDGDGVVRQQRAAVGQYGDDRDQGRTAEQGERSGQSSGDGDPRDDDDHAAEDESLAVLTPVRGVEAVPHLLRRRPPERHDERGHRHDPDRFGPDRRESVERQGER
jgi:hypothetical protein